MRLYHAITSYHLLAAMVTQAAAEEDAVLLIPIWIEPKYPNYKELSELFNDIIVYDIVYRYYNTKEQTADYFSWLLPEMKTFSEIYVWGAQFSFGIFLAEQEIPFIYCEEASGMLSRCEILKHIDEIDPKKKNLYPYVESLGLYTGDCPSAKTIYCNFSAQVDGFEHENLTDFRVIDAMIALSEDKRDKIIAFFIEPKEIHVPPDSTVLFTQHFANLFLTTFEEQALIYQLFVDYFFPGRTLVIKPHPDDLMYYSRLFPDAQVIRERFPSEFLPFLLDYKPQCVATIYSTAIYNLRGHYPEVFELDDRYEKDFVKTHRYYMALQIAQELQTTVFYMGTNEILLKKLSERIGVPDIRPCTDLHELALLDIPCTVLIDDLVAQGDAGREALQNILADADEKVVFLFINSQRDYCWYSIDQKDIWKHMIPVPLLKIPREGISEEDCYTSLEEEVFYVYSKNTQMLKKVNGMNITKELPHVGVDVAKVPLSTSDEKIKMLEGMLDATEQRLLHYISRVEELEKDKRRK